MTTKNSKLQLPISATLLEAINLAAAKDLRTQRAFITKILQEHPLIRDCIPKVLCEPNVKTFVPQCDAVAPLVTSGYVTHAVAVGLPVPAPAAPEKPPMRGLKEYLASGGLNDDCTTVGGPLRVRSTGEPLDINR